MEGRIIIVCLFVVSPSKVEEIRRKVCYLEGQLLFEEDQRFLEE